MNETDGKLAVFFSSVIIGGIGGVIAFQWVESVFGAVVRGFIVALLNPVVAATCVRIIEDLMAWALIKPKANQWDVGTRAYVGAFWPFTTLFWLVGSIFFAIINRLWKSSDHSE